MELPSSSLGSQGKWRGCQKLICPWKSSLTLRPRMPVKLRMMVKTMMAVRMRKTFLVKRRMMRMTKILRMSRRPMVMVEVGMMTMTMKMEMERKRTMRKEKIKRLPSHLLKRGNDLEGLALVLPLLQWLRKLELRLRVRVTV
ncbi:unnamed protein product [Coffea canephora]|uniref:Uncharacterized protein n=1 Tax=Coffea canephora TaxID=49390 RepID=A0A068V0K3_COFCA|nr:unnamed protein product [Coffea canephora]